MTSDATILAPILVDTSALMALLDADDLHNPRASQYWRAAAQAEFATHAYVLAEAIALVRARLRWLAVRELLTELMPRIEVEIVDQGLHDAAIATYLVEQGGTSFVDRVSIEFARRRGIDRAFAFDRDLTRAGLAFPEVP
jgi:predicted nucleic acid-binding protein